MNIRNGGRWPSRWLYAYRKLRAWHCVVPVAALGAVRFMLTGSTGYIKVSAWVKRRLVEA